MPSVRRHVFIASPPRTVWAAITTGDGLAKWLASEARFDGRKGGRVVLTLANAEGEPYQLAGIVHRWRPTSQLEIKWDRAGDADFSSTRVQFQVARDGDETRLSVVHSGTALDDEAAQQRVDLGWRAAFAVLQSQLDAP